MASLHYSLLGLQLLGEKIEDASTLCSSVSELANDGNVETLYHAAGVGAALGCPLTLGSDAAQAVESSLGEGATTASLFFAAKTKASVGAKLDGDLAKFFDRIEDAVVQADEVDGKMLQFEG